jgi:predicted transcriptional regulator
MDTNNTENPDFSNSSESETAYCESISRKKWGNILLSAIKLHFCQKHRLTSTINFATLATKSGLSLDDVKSVIHYLADNGLCRYQGEQLTELDDIAFTVFEVKSFKQSKQVVKNALKAEYQNSDKPRKPRHRVKNNPALIKTHGNRCGHNKNVLPVFKLLENSKKRPPVTALMFKKISNYFSNPKGVLPKLNDARKKRKKSGETRQQRSERREACIFLLGAVLSRLDLVTMRVGCPINDKDFTGIKLESLADIAGISFTRAERAMHDLVNAGLISIEQKCEKLADGTYKGYAAIRLVSTELFKSFNLFEELKEAREKLAKRAAKKLKDVMPLSLKELIQAATDQQAALKASGLTPSEAAFANLRGSVFAKN